MEPKFWHERWESNQIGFHQEDINPHLEQFWPSLPVPPGATVFVPMCGKSRDMGWLRDQGHRVIGVELSPVAVQNYFSEQGITPERETIGSLCCYQGGGITLWCGDFFDLTHEAVAGVEAIYDRASLIALPPILRTRYARHLATLLPGKPILLVTVEYDQQEMGGPPFSVSMDEVETLYSDHYSLTQVADMDLLAESPQFASRGVTEMRERVTLLTPRP